MRKKNENKSVGKGFEIKEGSVNYKETDEKSLFHVGLTKKGNVYMSIRNDNDNVDFVSGFEMLNLLNQILGEFKECTIHYTREASKSGKEYEKATLVDIN